MGRLRWFQALVGGVAVGVGLYRSEDHRYWSSCDSEGRKWKASAGMPRPEEVELDRGKDRPSRKRYKYVVCGGGTAAQEALKVLLKGDPSSSLLVVTEEVRPPFYQAPLWRWFRGKRPLHMDGSDVLVECGVHLDGKSQELVLDRVIDVNARDAVITLASGDTVGYERCLLAFGGSQETMPWQMNGLIVDGRSHQGQYQLLRMLAKEKLHVTVVGGGWIPCYMAAILSASKKAYVTMVFPEAAPLSRYLPKYMTDQISMLLKANGVEVLPYTMLRWVHPTGKELELNGCRTYDSSDVVGVRTDVAVFAPTSVPSSTDVADVPTLDKLLQRNPDLGGIDCGPELQAASNLYVAGDMLTCAHQRSQSHYCAVSSGHHAGVNMLGGRECYESTRVYTADIPVANATVTCVGDVDATKDTLAFFASTTNRISDLTRSGVIFYMEPRTATVTGVLLWNCSRAASVDPAAKVVKRQNYEDPPVEQDLKELAVSLFQEKDKDLLVLRYYRTGRRSNKGTSYQDDEKLWDSKPRAKRSHITKDDRIRGNILQPSSRRSPKSELSAQP